MAHTTAPSLNTDDASTLLDDTKLDTVVDTPLQTTVDILLPNLDVEVGLGLREVEGIDTTVQVRIPGCGFVTGDHDNRANGPVLGEQTSGLTTVSTKKVNDLNSARYEKRKNSYLVVKTRMAPAFSSKLALTADIAIASTVSAGRGQRVRNSSKMLK